MLTKVDRDRLIILVVLIGALILFTFTQSNLSLFMLLPIVLFTLVVSWYLYKIIQADHQEHLKESIHNIQEERDAQIWLHRSFVPKVRRLAQKEMKIVIITSGLFLMSFIFLWSYFVSGATAALLNTFIGLVFFVIFIIYSLYTPHEFNHIFQHVPERYRHHSKNDWVHAYILLFPFAMLGYIIYSLTTTGEGVVQSLINTVVFLFSYTFLFICVYCCFYLYKEYQRETDQAARKAVTKTLDENK
ncbi:MAG TPA: hypothetical protein VLF93_07990 [Candidatus Saccharimonadales bacterium]|nr:hypothetical protein [Candidatus Saccharimonadales bacterium]